MAQRRTSKGGEVLPRVAFHVKNGIVILQLDESHPTQFVEVKLSSERLAFISHYLRARRAFRSDVKMAEKLGIDRTRIIAWKKGSSAPRQEQIRYLADVATTVDALCMFLHPAIISDWLTTPKFDLAERTPVEMLREGRLPEVLQTVNAEHAAY